MTTPTNHAGRRSIGAVLAAGVAIAAAAVGGASGASASGDPASSDTEFTVAAVLPSAANDLAFSQSMVDSLDRLKEAGVIDDFVFSENMFVVEDAATAIRSYAEEGHDLVIAHGSQYGGSLEQIAPDYPETAFAWGTAADTFGLDNVSGYTASSDQGAYVMGAMAATMRGEGSIGLIGPIEVGDAKLYVDGFSAGVASVDPDVDVGVNYTESFSDTALAAEAATAFIDGGATVLSGSAQMTVGAVGVASERGALWFGTNSNQTQLAPEIVVANQVYHWDVVLADLVASIDGAVLGGTTYDINLGNEGLVIEFNPDFEIPEDVQATADDLIAQLASGELETGVAADAPDGSAPTDTTTAGTETAGTEAAGTEPAAETTEV
jgi:basic membrane protein A